MPSIYFSRNKGLQASSEFLLGRGQNFLFGNTLSFPSQPFSTLGHSIDQPPQSSFTVLRNFITGDRRKGPSFLIGTLSRTFSVLSVTGPSSQPCLHNTDPLPSEPNQRFACSLVQRNIMSACNSLLGRAELGARHLENMSSSGQILNSAMRAVICYSYKGLDHCRRISGSLRNRQPWGTNMVYRCFWSNATGTSWKSNFSLEPGVQDFQSQCTVPYSAGAAPDVSLDETSQEEQFENLAVPFDQKVLGDRSLKLLSGSCYLPHPDKEETGGEDAHFICVEEQAIGVADGVGGWADLGVDAGQYARELISNSVSAIREEPKGSIDPARVLEKAYSSTKAKGSSTACIIALTHQGIHAVNLGDSGFIVVRDGCTIFRSPVQQHDFNFTYQLESGNGSDLPSSAQVFTFPVAPGDVIIAGTDGLFDNLYNNEVTAVVVHAVRARLGPQVTAQKIAALARQRAQDRNRQTPFSSAAQDAGYRFYGGKLDDITVVVSYISASSS
ncbi:probable protein phosphatase 2C 55 isoform X2 [Phoenix dactylifera]|uniref:Protein phosphatase n=1 Tax=Phoenix dactylifera TaxID=42345 RepID=A0A8B7BV78_PHODC|nr:probable protein phosphatase 2C 55 isoform X2 [Phoenix dactylifera]